MNYQNLFKNFINSVPEAEKYCQDIIKSQDIDENDGMHICFGFAVRPYVKQVLLSGDRKTLIKIADYFEKMETSENPLVAEVLEQSVIEHLMAEDRRLIKQFDDVWGPETKEAFKSVGQWIL